MNDLELGLTLRLDFKKLQSVIQEESVIPVVVQHAETKDVLILAYVNEKALVETIKRKIAVFWSTSRQSLWVKGESSGDYLDMKEIRVNCEQNSLLFLVLPKQSGVCHVKDKHGQTKPTCFYRRLRDNDYLESLN